MAWGVGQVTYYGVKSDSIKFTPGIDKRIEEIGRLNDRRRRYNETRDRQALLLLAEEYRKYGHGMPLRARQIRREAERMGFE